MGLTPLEVMILFKDKKSSGGSYQSPRGGCLGLLIELIKIIVSIILAIILVRWLVGAL
ncbi:hypothetical protein RyT2_13700 [Pseudolactococcus yaeyamensis]